MKACTFFGHANAPCGLERKVYDIARQLIEEQGVELFYIGNHGNFDRMAYTAIKKLKSEFPQIRCYRVLSHLPVTKDVDLEEDTLIPEGIETVHGRYSVVWRNRWMLDRADYVITYVTHAWGGAAKFKQMAEKKGKIVINLA